MAVDFEKEYDDQVYEDEYYEEHFEEEELVDEEDLGAAGFEEVDISEDLEESGDNEADDADDLDDEDPAKKKKKNLLKIEVSYACEDCDYRWEDYILKKKDELDDGEDFDVVCPMCGSTTITLI